MFYIKGNKVRGSEVIALLESKGGINSNNLIGNCFTYYYYIDKNNIIVNSYIPASECIKNLCEEIVLPDKKEEKNWSPKFKVGDYVRIHNSDAIGKIKAIDVLNHRYDIIFIDDSLPFRTIVESGVKEWIPKKGETVLVRNCDNWDWEEAVFSFNHTYPNGKKEYHTVGGNNWEYCIPFDENKLGKVTED